ncbi:hypothetical protein NPIL_645031, partial [Nephila pilipes]
KPLVQPGDLNSMATIFRTGNIHDASRLPACGSRSLGIWWPSSSDHRAAPAASGNNEIVIHHKNKTTSTDRFELNRLLAVFIASVT